MSGTGADLYSWSGYTNMINNQTNRRIYANGLYTGYVMDNACNLNGQLAGEYYSRVKSMSGK